MLTRNMIRVKIREIEEKARTDAEAAHGLEDKLFEEVLETIEKGAKQPRSLARVALTARNISFPRYCA
jgi:hypothetical protein